MYWLCRGAVHLVSCHIELHGLCGRPLFGHYRRRRIHELHRVCCWALRDGNGLNAVREMRNRFVFNNHWGSCVNELLWLCCGQVYSRYWQCCMHKLCGRVVLGDNRSFCINTVQWLLNRHVLGGWCDSLHELFGGPLSGYCGGVCLRKLRTG